jgi:phospholipid/cholesterol/gamma-HCH transport system substrate-binding protein
MSNNINQTILNLESGTKGLDDAMDAVKNSFLLRGYFKKKAKRELQLKQDSLELIEKRQKTN